MIGGLLYRLKYLAFPIAALPKICIPDRFRSLFLLVIRFLIEETARKMAFFGSVRFDAIFERILAATFKINH